MGILNENYSCPEQAKEEFEPARFNKNLQIIDGNQKTPQ